MKDLRTQLREAISAQHELDMARADEVVGTVMGILDVQPKPARLVLAPLGGEWNAKVFRVEKLSGDGWPQGSTIDEGLEINLGTDGFICAKL